MNPIYPVLATSAAIVLVIVSVAYIAVSRAEKRGHARVAAINAQAEADRAHGAHLLQVAYRRRAEGRTPDSSDDFDRNLAIDALAAQAQLLGVTLPPTHRELLGYLTSEELRAGLGADIPYAPRPPR